MEIVYGMKRDIRCVDEKYVITGGLFSKTKSSKFIGGPN